MRFVVAFALLSTSCSPVAMFLPKDLPRDPPLVMTSSTTWPKSEVQIITDDFGVPHIYGKSEADLAYGLGVMHGRDRAFQIFVYAHAGEGRLTEVLGEDLLDVDRDNRLLMTGVDEEIAATDPRDTEMAEAYCAGVNAGALKSAEMSLLGLEWEPITPRDVLAIVRLQQWDQGVGFSEESARYRLVKAMAKSKEGEAIKRALLVDMQSGGVPVVAASEDEAHAPAPAPPQSSSLSPSVDDAASTSVHDFDSRRGAGAGALAEAVSEMFARGGTGASNSWSVSPQLTTSGHAVLANDPHLAHSTPGVFYMADMHGPDFVAAGGTFPGIPAVLIGHGKNVAWGVTNAYADTQDLVVLDRHGDSYKVDGKDVHFGKVVQKFKIGKDKVVEETWSTSMFGPVLPKGYGGWVNDDALALLWTAIEFPKDNGKMVSAFWDLAKSKNVDDATAAVQNFSSPAMNVNMAFTDGTIAYRLSGIIPRRESSERVDYPRDGTKSSAGWDGRLSADEKPHSTNPAKGYIIATNQRVVENGVGAQASVGFESARPYRAMRIDARIHELIDGGKKAETDKLLAIQQDITSIEAQQLAPIYAKHCPKHVAGFDDAHVAAFCKAIADFDGVFSEDSVALPFARTNQEFGRAILRAHFDESLVEPLLDQGFVDMALVDAAVNEEIGAAESPLFDDPKTDGRDGIGVFVERAVDAALPVVFEESGGSVDDWHWGKIHTMSPRGLLARAPLIGGLFDGPSHPESGTSTTPRAEHPDYNHHMRVVDGAGLRLIAEMSDPPVVRMVNDSGQSGHFGSKHLFDQNKLWHEGKPRVLSMSIEEAEKVKEGSLVLKPKP
jgi:penicillin amidase